MEIAKKARGPRKCQKLPRGWVGTGMQLLLPIQLSQKSQHRSVYMPGPKEDI